MSNETHLTTTQTGSGNGAAPDGVPGRITPGAPGWWYAQWAHDEPSDDGSLIVRVQGEGGRLFVHLGGVTSDLRAFRFLAPIPSSAVCVALAAWFAAWEADDLEAGHDDERWDAESDLIAAIRAERGGDA